MLSAQSKQTSTAALEQSRPSHRRSASESSGGARGRRPGAAGAGGDRGSPSAGRKHAAHSLLTLAQLHHKRAAVSSKVCLSRFLCKARQPRCVVDVVVVVVVVVRGGGVGVQYTLSSFCLLSFRPHFLLSLKCDLHDPHPIPLVLASPARTPPLYLYVVNRILAFCVLFMPRPSALLISSPPRRRRLVLQGGPGSRGSPVASSSSSASAAAAAAAAAATIEEPHVPSGGEANAGPDRMDASA